MTRLPDFWRDVSSPFAPASYFGSLRPLLRQLDEAFNEAVSTRQDGERARTLVPACDVEEAADHYALYFDMPGLEPDDLDIEAHGDRLTVRGERKLERNVKGEGNATRFSERRIGRFERHVTLPQGVDAAKIEATYRNGVLSLTVPKAAAEKPTKIKVGDGKNGSLRSIQNETQQKSTGPSPETARQAAAT
jgi:HSP20 family protein